MTSVLIVDDDPWFSDIARNRLEKSGIKVNLVLNALEAIDNLDQFIPDAIVLDIFLPGPNGIVFLHEIQSHTDLSQIPIIVWSSQTKDLSVDKLRAYGVKRIIDKTTVNLSEIELIIRQVIDEKHQN